MIKCIPVVFNPGFNVNYLHKCEKLNKAYIINKITYNQNAKDYLPDNVSPMSLSKRFFINRKFFIFNFFS